MMGIISVIFSAVAIRIQQHKQKLAKIERLNNLCEDVSIYAGAVTAEEDFGICFAETGSYNKLRYNKGSVSSVDWLLGNFSSLDVIGVTLGPAEPVCKEGSILAVFHYLKNFPELKEANLSMCPLSDEDIRILVISCPNLTHVDVTNTNLTDVSLKHFSKLKHLEILDAHGTDITGEGFQEVANSCVKIRYLKLTSSVVTDKGLSEITEWQMLNGLAISDNYYTPPSSVTVFDPKKSAIAQQRK